MPKIVFALAVMALSVFSAPAFAGCGSPELFIEKPASPALVTGLDDRLCVVAKMGNAGYGPAGAVINGRVIVLSFEKRKCNGAVFREKAYLLDGTLFGTVSSADVAGLDRVCPPENR